MAAPNNCELVPAAHEAAVSLPVSAPAPMTFQAVMRMAELVVKGQLFPHIKTPEQALTLMMLAQADGLHPIDAVRRYDIIQGRPAMKAMTIQAEFQKAGGKIQFHKSDDEACDATFTAPDGSDLRVIWDMKKAANAGLTSKPGPWKQFPGAMLRARCVSEGVRAVYPGVCLGIYASEEVQFFDPLPPQEAPVVEPTPVRSLPSPERRLADKARGGGERSQLPAPPQEPAPAPERRPMSQQEIDAMHSFGEACTLADIDILGDDNKFSRSKMEALVRRLLSLKDSATVGGTGMWKAAQAKLETEGMPQDAAQAERRARAERLRNTLSDDDFEDFEDPFAEDEVNAPKAATKAERLL